MISQKHFSIVLTAASFINMGTLNYFYVVEEKARDIFVIANKPIETKMNNKLIFLTSAACGAKA